MHELIVKIEWSHGDENSITAEDVYEALQIFDDNKDMEYNVSRIYLEEK
jgi:hypothetical protein